MIKEGTTRLNVMITGAFGFVGTNLSSHLKNILQANIIAVDLIPVENQTNYEFVSWDELGKIDGKGIDAIIHLAGKAHDTKNTTVEKEYFDVNLGLTKRIFDFFLNSQAEKFIFFSSVKAVADRVDDEILIENTPADPQTPYGKSKLAAEKYLSEQQLPAGKKVYIMRPCMIHGPGNKGNLNLLYKLVKSGIPWPLGGFDNKRSFTSIDNLMYTIDQMLLKDIKPGVYQMADDEYISTNKLVQLIAASQGKKPIILNINKNIILWLAKLGDLIRFPLNTERLKKLTESYLVSNEKLKNAIGIEKMPLSAIDGMKKTLDSFL